MELNQALKNTKEKKSPGIDGIFPEFLTHLGLNAKEALLSTINLTWNKYIPQQWRKAEIVPILKKGKLANAAESYRPVALTSAVCKVAEKMVANRLNYYLEAQGLIDDAQAGFRKHRCTMDHVVNFSQHVKDGYHRKMSTLAVLVDLKAAYDTVWRSMLMHKLTKCEISGKLYNWIKSFLSQRLIRVRYSNCTSRFRVQKQGLPQGAVLSCLLFNIMVNDILDSVRSVPGGSSVRGRPSDLGNKREHPRIDRVPERSSPKARGVGKDKRDDGQRDENNFPAFHFVYKAA